MVAGGGIPDSPPPFQSRWMRLPSRASGFPGASYAAFWLPPEWVLTRSGGCARKPARSAHRRRLAFFSFRALCGLEAFTREPDQGLLGTDNRFARFGRALDVGAVWLHVPRVSGISELHVQDLAQQTAWPGGFDGCHRLDAILQVALHAVGRADKILLVAAVSEVKDAGVFEKRRRRC